MNKDIYLTEEAVQQIIRLSIRYKCEGEKLLSKRIGISKRTLRDILNQKPTTGSLSTGSIAKFMIFLGISKVKDFKRLTTAKPESQPSVVTGLPAGAFQKQERERIYDEQMRSTNDPKNVIFDSSVSQSLLPLHLVKESTPSFFICVSNTEVHYADNQLKDSPRYPNTFDFNHFFQLGMILEVQWPKQTAPIFLGYPRKPRGSQFIHTTSDKSCLWGASFLANFSDKLNAFPDRPMDQWISLAKQNPQKAEIEFLHGREPLFLRLMKHKINLTDLNAEITPYGVATNDQRGPKTKRVYTQYVFRVKVRLTQHPESLMDLAKVMCPSQECVELHADQDPEKSFVSYAGKTNNMDIAVWKSLSSTNTSTAFKSAAFRLGFGLI